MDATVKVEGLREARAAFRRVGDTELGKALARANKAAAQLVVTAALPHVPVRTGRLRGAVRALGSQASGRAVAGSAAVPYAAAVHFGVGPRPGLRGPHNIQPNPFLVNAAERMADEIAAQYEAEVGRILDEALR